jgi:hypothetical protein
MSSKPKNIDDLDQAALARLAMDMFHRIVIHYALWFTEVRHQMGANKALETLENASRKSIGNQLRRLGKTLGFDMAGELPAPLANLDEDQLRSLLSSIAVNWLANDGIWFQSVEFTRGMNDAKRCNDSCWAHFSPYEASAIKSFLQLDNAPGLAGLQQALNFRLYALLNRQSFSDEQIAADGSGSFVFQMNKCRVQHARQRKGLDDYPCKSAGLVEYSYFAEAIDGRIQTKCIGCPPDPHPIEWFCAWRFSITPTD